MGKNEKHRHCITQTFLSRETRRKKNYPVHIWKRKGEEQTGREQQKNGAS